MSSAWERVGFVLARRVWQDLDDAGLTEVVKRNRHGVDYHRVVSAHGAAFDGRGEPWRKPWYCAGCGMRLIVAVMADGKGRWWHPRSDTPTDWAPSAKFEAACRESSSACRWLSLALCRWAAYDKQEWGAA